MDESGKIPRDFYCFETGMPFTNCIQCGCDLLVEGQQYLIERSIKKYPGTTAIDVIYEYAMCFTCAMEQKKMISSESLQRLEAYFQEKVTMENAQQSYNLIDETRQCAIYGTSVQQMSEYVLQATCNGNRLVEGIQPLVFGPQATDEMEKLISAQTRDEMDDFIDTHFSGPPEWRELLRNKPLLI